jgi:large subunit ribosomal protein L3
MTQIFWWVRQYYSSYNLKVGPCVITQVKTQSKNGYDSIQIGGNVSSKTLTQPELGHLQKSNIQPLKYLKEFRVDENNEFKIGQVLNVDSFSPGQLVNIRGKVLVKVSLAIRNVGILLEVQWHMDLRIIEHLVQWYGNYAWSCITW